MLVLRRMIERLKGALRVRTLVNAQLLSVDLDTRDIRVPCIDG